MTVALEIRDPSSKQNPGKQGPGKQGQSALTCLLSEKLAPDRKWFMDRRCV